MDLSNIKWGDDGLIPVVVQDQNSGQIRMVAFANRTALDLTLERRYAHFYSRSRKEIWKKGESSGHTLAIKEVWTDCDADALIYLVEPEGPTCHTGKEACFFECLLSDGPPQSFPEPTLARLWRILESRKEEGGARSYTRSLLEKGPDRIAAKIYEEGSELAAAVRNEADKRVISEAADVTYHMLVGLLVRDVTWKDVLVALARRFGISGIDEKNSRVSMRP
ncbi:MAG: bifunctional phosphoribosyl-AMP cyclohydrolase/phosphoribosyl-ATP diphosphatase HisIE [Myxococcales bacterium]|nr:bifunctional phosphoribosyl-AMP cyclohydrolase/phosphoribosyl-ATP diphosphatase HisIE [Myxococcales bacterium]